MKKKNTRKIVIGTSIAAGGLVVVLAAAGVFSGWHAGAAAAGTYHIAETMAETTAAAWNDYDGESYMKAEEYYEMPAAEMMDGSEETGYYSDEAGFAETSASSELLKTSLYRAAAESEKLVYSGDLAIQTLDYDGTLKAIRTLMNRYGGLIEWEEEYDDDQYWYYTDDEDSSDSRLRNASMRLRIPSEHFTDFLDEMASAGKVMSRNVSVDNISRSYADTSALIKALETEETRLLEMMDKAETIEEMIMVEDRLTEVQSELNTYRSYLSDMDTDVAYSSVYIDVREVREYREAPVVEPGFGDRIRSAFSESWENLAEFGQDLAIFLAAIFPFLLIIAAVIVIVVLVRRRRRAKKAAAAAQAGQTVNAVPQIREQDDDDTDDR